MNRNWKKIIAIVEMLGGVGGAISGLFFMLWGETSGNATQADVEVMAIFMIPIVLFLFSFLAGFCLWRESRLGYPLSVIIQVLQIPVISSADFTYIFTSGFQLGMGIGLMKFNFLFNIGGLVDIGLAQGDPFVMGINIIPILFLWKLYKSRKETETVKPF